jgi:hypothetical protein
MRTMSHPVAKKRIFCARDMLRFSFFSFGRGSSTAQPGGSGNGIGGLELVVMIGDRGPKKVYQELLIVESNAGAKALIFLAT